MPKLAAFFAAVEQEFARVLEVVAIDNSAQDALRGNGRAGRGDDQRDFALRHDGDRRFQDPVLPAAIPEVQTRAAACRPGSRPRR